MMSCTTISLLLAVATSAEGNLMPWQKTPALASLMKQIADSNGRRLQSKWMDKDCSEACPDTMKFLTAVMEAGDISNDMAKMMEVMCPHEGTILCLASTPACIGKGEEQSAADMLVFPCACACPTLATMGK
jgi:hypothetical protein